MNFERRMGAAPEARDSSLDEETKRALLENLRRSQAITEEVRKDRDFVDPFAPVEPEVGIPHSVRPRNGKDRWGADDRRVSIADVREEAAKLELGQAKEAARRELTAAIDERARHPRAQIAELRALAAELEQQKSSTAGRLSNADSAYGSDRWER